jgi:hypothetical protein
MKITNKKFRLFSITYLILGLMTSQYAQANVINSDFGSAFDDWQGEVITYNYGIPGDTESSGDIFGSFADNFDTLANSATVMTTSDEENDYWSVVLFQDFTVNTVTAGSRLTLSLDVSFNLTNSLYDNVFAQLLDLDDNLSAIDLTSGGDFDITAWHGANVTIQFGVVDGDYDLFDSLTVSNLSITETFAEVPEPATMFIFLVGVVALIRKRCAIKSSFFTKRMG